MPEMFRAKPNIVKVVKYTGVNKEEILKFVGKNGCLRSPETKRTELIIHTKEEDLSISFQDYIIRGPLGNFYPMKPDEFRETFESLTGE